MKIEQMNLEQLRALNIEVVDRIRRLQAITRMDASQKLRRGQKVYFDSKTRGRVFGTITKVNTVTVQLLSTAGTSWKVSSTMVKLDDTKGAK